MMIKSCFIYFFITAILFSANISCGEDNLPLLLQKAEQWAKTHHADNIVSQKIFLRKIEHIQSSNTSDSEKIKVLRSEFPQIFNTSIEEHLRLAKHAGVVFSKDNRTILSTSNKNITAITIPGCVTVIANEAFSQCGKLTRIDIPGSVVYIGKEAFYRCSKLRSVTMTDSVKEIGTAAFQFCSSLENIRLSDHLRCLPGKLFWGCKSLESITFPRRMTAIKQAAFYESGIKHAVLPPTLQELPDSLFESSALESVTIPATVHTIGRSAFDNCGNLQQLIWFEGVKNIRWSAFADCRKLRNITIPASVKNIESRAFKGTSNVKISPENKKFAVDKDGALIDLDSGDLISLPPEFAGVYTIPEGIVKIRSNAFSGCDKLESVVFPSTFKELEEAGFAGSGIEYINIPPVITAVPEMAFANCYKLRKVYLHEKVYSLEKEAFQNCGNLTNMNLYHVKDIFRSAVKNTPYRHYYTLDELSVPGKIYRRKMR